MGAFGVTPDKPLEAPEIEVWPENWTPLQLMDHMSTQWHSGMGGRSGLMYSEAWRWMDETGLTEREARLDVMQAAQVMERELLRIWRKQSEERAR